MMTEREITEDSVRVFGGVTRPHEFTVKEYAHIERVDERTVRRWISKGAVEYRKTPGGGVRILAGK
jgi:hypothetical protein